MEIYSKKHIMKNILLGLLLFVTITTKAQVGVGTTTPVTSAMLEVKSTSKGFLPPRLTYTQRQAISGPVAGLIIWCSNCGTSGEVQVYNGTTWTNMMGGNANIPLAIGDNYGGGKVAYIFQSGDPGYIAGQVHGLIASISNISSGTTTWNNGTTTANSPTGTAIGTGLTNTNAIISSYNLGVSGGTENYAAKLCADYSITVGGVVYDDWYLPSKDELSKLYLNRVFFAGYSNYDYWSSSDYDASNVWVHDFINGFQWTASKSDLGYVRAVRSF